MSFFATEVSIGYLRSDGSRTWHPAPFQPEPHEVEDDTDCPSPWHTDSEWSADMLAQVERQALIIEEEWDEDDERGFARELAQSLVLRIFARIYGFAPVEEPPCSDDELTGRD